MNPRKLTQRHRIRFAECDPTGIVFSPRYFVIPAMLREALTRESIDE